MEFRGVRLKKQKFGKFAKGFYVLRDAENYIVPLAVGADNQSKRVVKVGDIVKEGTLLAVAKGKYGNYVYSPCCGKVVGVIKKMNISGNTCEHIVINREMKTDKDYLPVLDATQMESENLLKRLYESGIVDNFPPFDVAYKKYLLKNAIKDIIINCTETDPYEHATTAVFENYLSEVFEGALLFKKVSKAERLVFAFTTKQTKLVKLLKAYLKKRDMLKKVKIKVFPNLYPMSYSRLMAYYHTGKMVRDGARTAEIGVIVEGAVNCYDFYQAVYNGKPCIERPITITGDNCIRKANYFVKNGTPIGHIMEIVGFRDENFTNMLIYGGIMTGVAQETENVSVSLTASTVLLCNMMEFILEKERVCINCGKCVESCPVRIHVKDVDDAFEARDYSLAKKLGAETCLNCGVCTYVCPAKRDLAQKVNFMKNFATGRSNKNSEDSDYVLLEGEDADTTYSFDKILDVVNMAKTNKKTEKPLPVAKDHTSNLNEIRIDKIKPEGGNKNE